MGAGKKQPHCVAGPQSCPVFTTCRLSGLCGLVHLPLGWEAGALHGEVPPPDTSLLPLLPQRLFSSSLSPRSCQMLAPGSASPSCPGANFPPSPSLSEFLTNHSGQPGSGAPGSKFCPLRGLSPTTSPLASGMLWPLWFLMSHKSQMSLLSSHGAASAHLFFLPAGGQETHTCFTATPWADTEKSSIL